MATQTLVGTRKGVIRGNYFLNSAKLHRTRRLYVVLKPELEFVELFFLQFCVSVELSALLEELFYLSSVFESTQRSILKSFHLLLLQK